MILHHYPTSPFAEKIRLIFGYKRMEWQGVEIPMVMPKPDLMPLTGGYRKTPVLQIGADMYCDTALICDVLEQMVPTPSLYHAAPKGLVRTVAQWADNVLFPVAMAYNFQPAGAQHVMASMPADVVNHRHFHHGEPHRVIDRKIGQARRVTQQKRMVFQHG